MNLKEIEVRGTIVSFYPFPIISVKPGLVPAQFEVPAGDPINKKCSVYHVDSVISRMYTGELGAGWVESMVPASELCQAIIYDFFHSSIFVDEGSRIGPGLTYLKDKIDEKELVISPASKYRAVLEETLNHQTEWFKILVNHADDSWSKVRQHRMITDLQKYAATFLKLDREWLTNLEIQKTQNVCAACGTMVPLTAIKCFNCGYILDVQGFEKIKDRFDFVGAKQKTA